MTAIKAENRQGHTVHYTGASGNALVASRFEVPDGVPLRGAALLMHGGGQTRHAWDATGWRLAARGFLSVAMDLRGHGDSAWVEGGHYLYSDFRDDAVIIAQEIVQSAGVRPFIIGASLGGLSGLHAISHRPDVFAGLILVDVTPKLDPDGVQAIQSFMRARAKEGFASLEEAGDAVAAYLPHRPRPKSLEGLRKNLRLREDGRYYWHWDPDFLDGSRAMGRDPIKEEERLVAAARCIDAPLLLVRGQQSELVGEAEAKDFLAHCPHAEFVDVAGARHMVAGDKNDVFADTIVDFIHRKTAA